MSVPCARHPDHPAVHLTRGFDGPIAGHWIPQCVECMRPLGEMLSKADKAALEALSERETEFQAWYRKRKDSE